MSDREFDLVLYGVTGFVGQLTAAYVATAAPAGVRIALAGRDLAKVEAVRSGLPSSAHEWPLIKADASDQASLLRMAERTRVVVTTVGPYDTYGLPLVLACADVGTDYADLTGEPLFVRDSIAAAHDRAIASGARIVHSCGFDSVPSDLNAYLTHRQTVEDATGELRESTLVATVKGGLSGGTIASARGQLRAIALDRSLQAVVDDPYVLAQDRTVETDLGPQSDAALGRAARIDPSLKGWVGTFLMAPHNTRIVRRSNSLLGGAYGSRFRYREVMSAGRSRAALMPAAGMAAGLWFLNRCGPLLHTGPGVKVLDRVVPKPGTGPSVEAQINGHYSMDTYTTTSTGARYHATFAQDGDPGYRATAVLLGEVGLCLAIDRDRLPSATGVLTPAVAMADPLVDRLRAAGATITVRRQR